MTTRPSQNPSHLTPQEIGKPQSPELKCFSLRLSNICGAALWLSSFFFILPALSHAASPPELTVLRQQYEKVLAEKATAPFDASLALLNVKFTTALESAIATAQQAGKLDDILAIQDDKKRLAEKLTIPDDDDKTPDSLKKLRIIYREQLKRLEDTRTGAVAAVLPAYQTRLQDLETTITKAGRIDEALELRAYREGLAQTGPLSPVNGPPSTPSTAPTTPPVTAASAKVPEARADPRKTAEWVLSLGGRLSTKDQSSITKPEELPKGQLSITSIYLENKPITDAELNKHLTGLPDLQNLTLNYLINISDAGLTFMATLPTLSSIVMEKCPKLTDAWMAYLRDNVKLWKINIRNCKGITGLGFAELINTQIGSIQADGTSITDAALPHIAKLRNLDELTLNSTSVTDGGIVQLKALPKLTMLQVHRTAVSPLGLEALRGLDLKLISFGMSAQDLFDQAPAVGKLFPGLLSLHIGHDGDHPAESLAILARSFPKLTSLFSRSGSIDDASCEGFAMFPRLETIAIYDGKITDASIASFQKVKNLREISFVRVGLTDAALLQLQTIKSLKRLGLSFKVSDPALAALKKQRPDIQISR